MLFLTYNPGNPKNDPRFTWRGLQLVKQGGVNGEFDKKPKTNLQQTDQHLKKYTKKNQKNPKISLNTAPNTSETCFVTKKFYFLLKQLKKTGKKWKKSINLDKKLKNC